MSAWTIGTELCRVFMVSRMTIVMVRISRMSCGRKMVVPNDLANTHVYLERYESESGLVEKW